MTVLSKPLHSLCYEYPIEMDFEPTGNDEVDRALDKVSQMSEEDLIKMMTGLVGLTTILNM